MSNSRKGMNNRDNYVTTLARLYDYATLTYTKRLASTYDDGTQSYTYSEFRHRCNELSHLLSRYGISAGDKIAILAQNMPNWTMAYFSAVAFGRVAVPILPESSQNEITNIINHSDTKVLFVSEKQLPKISEEIKNKLTLIFDIETLELIKKDENAFTCDGWTKEPQPDDLACLIYTSGTTGSAKGVMLSHRNFCWNIIEAYHAQKCTTKDVWLSILPMAHTYEMALSMLYPFFVGAKVYYIHKPPTPTILLNALKVLRPTILCVVPLIIEKIYRQSVVPTVNKSRVLSWMRDHTPWLLYKMIGKRLYKTFGGRLKFLGIGGSKLDVVVEDFLKRAGMPYAIGYGLTECAPLVCAACVNATVVGSIGLPCYGVDVKLRNVNPETGEGEIVCRGDNLMLGYYKDPERTRQAIDDEGWYHTNDLAIQDKRGRFFIKGRLSNMILGASGENIYPEEIESVINNYSGVNESLVMERQGKLIALVKFDDNVLNWDQSSEDKFFENLNERKQALLDYINQHVNKSSKVNNVEVMKEPFEKTATHKIRRFKYKDTVGDDVKEGGVSKDGKNTPSQD